MFLFVNSVVLLTYKKTFHVFAGLYCVTVHGIIFKAKLICITL